MIIKDQYIKETSQIHAPLELIQRTRQAVREEEMRICRENMPQVPVEQSSCGIQPEEMQIILQPEKAGGRHQHKSWGKIYRWAMPVAAAAVLLLSVNVFRNISKGSASMLSSDTTSEQAEGVESAASDEDFMMWDAAPAEGAAEESMMPEEVWSGGAEDSMMADGGQPAEMAEDDCLVESGENSVWTDDVQSEKNQEDSKWAGSEMGAEKKEDTAFSGQNGEPDTADRGDQSDGANARVEELTVTEVKRMPELFENKDAEYITVQGIEFAVVQEGEDIWSAYVKIDEQGYVIAGEAADQDKFTSRAYDLIMETIHPGFSDQK